MYERYLVRWRDNKCRGMIFDSPNPAFEIASAAAKATKNKVQVFEVVGRNKELVREIWFDGHHCIVTVIKDVLNEGDEI